MYRATAIDGYAKGRLLSCKHHVVSVPIFDLKPYDVTDGPSGEILNIERYYFHNATHPDGRKVSFWSVESGISNEAIQKHFG